MITIAIETSCDETAIAIICNNIILSNKILSQSFLHRKYGGIVPDVAVRNHIEYLPYIIEKSIEQSRINIMANILK